MRRGLIFARRVVSAILALQCCAAVFAQGKKNGLGADTEPSASARLLHHTIWIERGKDDVRTPEAAGKATKQRIEEQYQWQQVAVDIEKAYFQVMGWQLPPALAKKPNTRVAAAGATGIATRRAG